jgi:hypothetical protein
MSKLPIVPHKDFGPLGVNLAFSKIIQLKKNHVCIKAIKKQSTNTKHLFKKISFKYH